MSSIHQSLLAFFRAATLLAAGVSVLLAVASARGATGTELGGTSLGRVLSTPETAEWLARHAGHRGDASRARGVERDGNPATAVVWSRWDGAGLPQVAHVRIEGGGHTIPQPGTRFPALLGPHSEDIDVPAEAWLFFDGGTRPRRRP